MANTMINIDRNQKIGNCNHLKEHEKRAYWILAEAILEMKERVALPINNEQELLTIYVALQYDYPELDIIWDYEKCRFSLGNRNGRKELTLYMKYRGTREEIKKNIQKIEEKVRFIIEESLGGKMWTDQEMVEQICKYLASHYYYSAPIGKDKKGENIYPEDSYNILCLLKGNGVCAGMASSLTYILHKLQIPVVTVLGHTDGRKNQGGHAWNIVQQSDGSFRHIDVTWDMGKNKYFLEYQNLDDVAMRVRRHFWEMGKYPCCV